MHTLELALQQYYGDKGYYPASSGTSGGDWSNEFKSDLAPYLSQVPIDPIIPNGYPIPNRYYIAGVDTSGLGWGQDGPNRGMSPCTDHFFVWFIMEVPKYPNPDAYTPCWNPSGTGSYLYARDLGKP